MYKFLVTVAALLGLSMSSTASTIAWIESDFSVPLLITANDSGAIARQLNLAPSSQPQGLAYDSAFNKLYWTELIFANARILSAPGTYICRMQSEEFVKSVRYSVVR